VAAYDDGVGVLPQKKKNVCVAAAFQQALFRG
jgi:hypothetical protein